MPDQLRDHFLKGGALWIALSVPIPHAAAPLDRLCLKLLPGGIHLPGNGA